jgi:hypothetical protein
MNRIFSFILFLAISLNGFANGIYIHSVTDTSKPLTGELRQSKDSNALVVVDGKVIGTVKDIKSFDSPVFVDSIKNINVLKGDAAVSKYGEKGRFGVIEIYLKDFEISEAGKKDEEIVEMPEIEAAFPGGDAIWRKYLERTLNGQIATDKKAPAGTYTVVVQFKVDKGGNISDVKAVTNHGYGMEQEVIRVISRGPKWSPAIQNGRQVVAYRRQPVTFVVMK